MAVVTSLFAGSVRAAEPAERTDPSREEVEAWLESRALPADLGADAPPEAPAPAPRDYGFVIETALGAQGHVGDLKNVSPTSPWFRLQVGWEPARWAMLVALADVAFGNTSYANRPPPPRGYALWGLGGGVRLTAEPWERIGVFVQGEIGAAEVTSDVLATYGFTNADELSPYFGGHVGLEWYQVSPHYALVFQGGVRNYGQLLDRQLSGETALAWTAAAALQYTF